MRKKRKRWTKRERYICIERKRGRERKRAGETERGDERDDYAYRWNHFTQTDQTCSTENKFER